MLIRLAGSAQERDRINHPVTRLKQTQHLVNGPAFTDSSAALGDGFDRAQ